MEGSSSPEVEAGALLRASRAAAEGRDYEPAIAFAERALTLYRSIRNPRMVAVTLRWLAVYQDHSGRPQDATRALQRAIGVARRYGLAGEHAVATHFLGEHELLQGRLERAAELLTESMVALTRAGRLDRATAARGGLADVRLEQGDVREAARLYNETLAYLRDERDSAISVYVLGGLAAAAAAHGDAETAGTLWGAIERYEKERGALLEEGARERYERRLMSVDRVALARARARGETMTFDQAVDYALSRARNAVH